MANDVITLTNPLVQYGVLGVIFAYVIYSDWLARKERAKLEARRAHQDSERENLRVQQDNEREKDCIKRIRELEDRQLKFMQTVSASTNTVLADLTRELRRHGFKINTPTNIQNGSQDETRVIHRKDSNHE